MRVILSLLLISSFGLFAGDNEIYIEQIGDGVEIIIEQTGSGNLVGQNSSTGASASDMRLQIENSNAYWLFNGSNNLLYGDINSDGSNIDYNLVGSTNRINQLIGNVTGNSEANFSADAIDINLDVQGSTNDMTFRIGSSDETQNVPTGTAFFNNSRGFKTYGAHTWSNTNTTITPNFGYGTINSYGNYASATSNYGVTTSYWDSWGTITEGAADSLDMDLVVGGSDNTIGTFVNSANATHNWNIQGNYNWVLTSMEDGADNEQTVALTGDKNYVFVGQRTGTSLTSTEAVLDASFQTSGSEITIIQQDTGE